VTRAADLSLDAEAAAALSRAATLAGDAGLASRLEELVSAYVPDREAAGSAPKLGRSAIAKAERLKVSWAVAGLTPNPSWIAGSAGMKICIAIGPSAVATIRTRSKRIETGPAGLAGLTRRCRALPMSPLAH
jgi:hypothetical protein